MIDTKSGLNRIEIVLKVAPPVLVVLTLAWWLWPTGSSVFRVLMVPIATITWILAVVRLKLDHFFE